MLLLFTIQFHELVRMRLPIGEGFLKLANESPYRYYSRMLVDLAESVNGGEPIYVALKPFTRVFPAYYVNVVRCGEETGALEDVLASLIERLRDKDSFHSRVTSILSYILTVQFATMFVLLNLVIFVVPQFEEIFKSFEARLPSTTQWLIIVSEAARSWPGLLFIAFGVGAVFFAPRLGRWVLRNWPNALAPIQRLPFLSTFLTKPDLCEAADVLNRMLTAGAPLPLALEDVAHLHINKGLSAAFMRIKQRVENGTSLVEAFGAEGDTFPPSFHTSILLGESSGDLAGSLRNTALSYRNEITSRARLLLEVLTPLLVCLTGAVVYVAYSGIVRAILQLPTLIDL